MINIPHLGSNRMLPNTLHSIYINKIESSYILNKQRGIKPIPHFRFDYNDKGFNPYKWPHVVLNGDDPLYFVLQPQEGSKVNVDSIVYTGCANGDELKSIFEATELSKYTSEVRKGQGLGEMLSYTYKHKFWKRSQCAIHAPANKKQHIKTRYYSVLNKCKKIFDKHFIGKAVGYEKLKEDLGTVFYDLNEIPLCYLT